MKHHADMERVTFWGVTDAGSWLNDWPVRGRTNYPLLFDRASQPKPAFISVLETAGQAKAARHQAAGASASLTGTAQ